MLKKRFGNSFHNSTIIHQGLLLNYNLVYTISIFNPYNFSPGCFGDTHRVTMVTASVV